jgi:hypothetical protein
MTTINFMRSIAVLIFFGEYAIVKDILSLRNFLN